LKHFTEREAVYYLWALCLQAELHDYAGRPKLAHRLLARIGPELEELMKDGRLGLCASPFSKRLLRQQLWTLVFWSHCHYRDEQRPKHLMVARSLLLQIPRLVKNKLVPESDKQPSEPSYGLLARVAYSLGQVYRQMSDVKSARREFMNAIEFTRKRLKEKAKKYTKNKVDAIREQVYAKYVIAKAFSFGLAWASYNSGELHRARMSAAAGCTLLETTLDPVHRAYAQVVYAGILSAVSRPVRVGEEVPTELREAVSMLRPLTNDASSPLKSVDRLMARARYALAEALHAAGHHDEAKEKANLIYQASEAGSRWHLECGVLLVQLHLQKKNHIEAHKQSSELMRLINEPSSVPDDVRIKVLFCHADVLLRTKMSDNDEIQELLKEASGLARNSPLLIALHHLHQARCYRRRGMMDAARVELSRWRVMETNIEHGYVHELADRVMQEIDEDDDRLVIESAVLYEEGFEKVEKLYKQWGIRRLHARCPSSPSGEECKRILGIGKRHLENWMKEIDFNPWRGGEKAQPS
jgi:tetratricopeptide (TPR) repeat protein